MNKLLFLISIILIFTISQSSALIKDDAIMIKGIRPMGMGGAFVAVSDDENAVFYNPAGITQRKGYLLQVISIDGTMNTQSSKAVFDSAKSVVTKNNGLSIDDFENIRDTLNNQDLDISLSLPNLLFISAPIKVGDNSLSFGLGAFAKASVGANIDLIFPEYGFALVKVMRGGASATEYPEWIVNYVPEELRMLPPDILSVFPADILEDFGSDYNIYHLDRVLETIKHSDKDSANYQTAIIDLYFSFDNQKARDNIAAFLEDLGDSDKSLADLLKALEDHFDKVKDIFSQKKDTAIINTYITMTADFPIAYRIKSLKSVSLPGELSIGANFKYIQRYKAKQLIKISVDDMGSLEKNFDAINLAAVSGSGFGIDFGSIYHFNPQWNFGLQISDIFTRINYDKVIVKYSQYMQDDDFTQQAYIAPQINVGAAWIPETILGFKTKNRWTFAADIRDILGEYETAGFMNKFHIGSEFRFSPFAIRLGLNKFYPSFGFGIEFNAFQLGYAFYGDESHLAKAFNKNKTVFYHEILISLKFGHHKGKPFGKDADKQKQEQQEQEKQEQQQKQKTTSTTQTDSDSSMILTPIQIKNAISY
jgi:hypothetical protein